MIKVNITKVVQALQYKMTRIVQEARARVVVNLIEKQFICFAIVQIFTRMDFVTKVDAILFINVNA